jgi:UDP-GlcNAc:undecaprenyl-phosphate GlcNAc-1-phosphate transferase
MNLAGLNSVALVFPRDSYWLAGLVACLTTLVALPLWRVWCWRTGLVDNPGLRKIHTQPVPLAGGLAVMTGILVPVLCGWAGVTWLRWGSEASDLLAYGLGRRGGQLSIILAGALAMLGLGWLDDKLELRSAVKFGGQLVIAVAVAAAGVRITLFVPSLVFSYAITVLWILTVTNALNFMDNMNGLCGCLGVIGAGYLALVAGSHGQYLVTLLAVLTAGSLLGFLPYNYPRATSFLGDAGSHLVGYLLAVLAILPHFYSSKHPHPWAVVSPLFILAVPLLDMVWVVLLRWRLGQPFYVGDNNHLSHRLVRRGWTKPQAVLLIWLLAIGGGLSALVMQR